MGRKPAQDGPVVRVCNCDNPNCDLQEKLTKTSDFLGIGLQTTSLLLSSLKATASASQVPGLKELAGGLLTIVTAIQDKNEVKGGFKHIIVDCMRVTMIVSQHAERRKELMDRDRVIPDAITQLQHELDLIKEYAKRRNDRGRLMRTIMGGADKAVVNEWRQRFSTSWNVFTTQIMMDTNYKVTKNDGATPNIAELAEKLVEQMAHQQQGKAQEQYFAAEHARPAHPPSPPPAQQSEGYDAQPQWNDHPQGDYQYPQNDSQASDYSGSYGGYSHGNSYADPQQYYDNQQNEYQAPPQYRHASKNPFRSQTGYPARPPPQHYPSDPEYYTDSHQSGYSTPYDPYYAHGYHAPPPPAPHRYYTLPAPPPPSSYGSPVNNIGNVKNANFGVNHGTITQHAY